MTFRTLPVLLLLWCLPALAAPPLEQIMADPDWIGPPVQQAWWSLDGRHAYYQVKQAGSPVRQLRTIDLASGQDAPVADADRAGIDGPAPVFDAAGQRAAFIRDGNLFLRDLASGQLRQLTAGPDAVGQPTFTTDGRLLVASGERWLLVDPASGLARPLADLRWDDEPDTVDDKDVLVQTQLRLFDTLQRTRDDRASERERELELARADDSRRPAPWYLGKKQRAVATLPSPDLRWLLVASQPAEERPAGARGKMPNYVTESGYTEVIDVRSRVGRPLPTAHALELLDLDGRQRLALDLATLPGIDTDPLAELRQGENAPKAPERRALTVIGSQWSDDGRHLALMLRAVDNKDRWLVTLEPARSGAAMTVVERLSDAAWIGWSFNEFGWLPGSQRLWFLSEASGHSHLHHYDAGNPRRGSRALTRGDWEVSAVQLGRDGRHFWFVGNRSHPTVYELYRLPVGGGEVEAMTAARGVERFVTGPDPERVLVIHSEPYIPAQLGLLEAGNRQLRRLTDTRTPEYAALEWPALEIVGVPSSHQEQPLWSKLYLPADMEPGKRYPAVLFVHGAGYLQNTHWRFPQYYREQMFHNLLTERGFVVLDIDYRASAGYGRDWRTAIYRQMGHPELEDLIDGIDWLAANHQVDPERIGVYGGSYGGFMALMSLFREPDRFLAGAALRPVTDWRHYNHGYTANILNTPDLDPEAHRISSPIEYADGLRGHLLIAHGMLDDNVFYQDVVMLAQRLIELGKDNWELASYPLEGHGYVHPESWFDQYRRVLKLFERTLLP